MNLQGLTKFFVTRVTEWSFIHWISLIGILLIFYPVFMFFYKARSTIIKVNTFLSIRVGVSTISIFHKLGQYFFLIFYICIFLSGIYRVMDIILDQFLSHNKCTFFA